MSALASTPQLVSVAVEPVKESALDSIVFYGLLATLLFGPLAFGAVEPWSIFILQSAAAALFALWGVWQATTKQLVLRGNPLFAPMATFAVLIFIQYLARITAYRYDTISSSMLFASFGMLCFLTVQCVVRVRQIKTLAVVLGGFGLLLSVEALFQSLSSHGRLYWIRTPGAGWVYGPYVNHNHYAGLMEMLLPIPLVISLTRLTNTTYRLIAAGAAIVMAASIFLSGSRGGMLAFAVQMAVVATLLLKQKYSPRIVLAAGISLAIFAGLLVWLGGSELSARLASIHAEARQEISGGIRLTIERDSLKMYKVHPVFGWGLGTFPEVYPEFRSFYTNLFVNQAHNDYLQLLVETGAVGFGIMIWFLVVVFRRAIHRMKEWQTDLDGAVAVAALLGVSGILIHSFLDFNLEIPANAALFYVLCTLAAMEPRFRKSRVLRARRRRSISENPDEPMGELQ